MTFHVIGVMVAVDHMRDRVLIRSPTRSRDGALDVLPIVGGASRSTTPSEVVKNADW